jgi:hypothetical protein
VEKAPIKIIVDNSTCRALDLPVKHFEALRNLMSYMEDTGGYGAPKYRRHLMTAKGEFPTGLLPILKKYLVRHKIYYNIVDNRIVPTRCEGMFKFI